MAILSKCGKCDRMGGFALSPADEICARCKRKAQKEKEIPNKKHKDDDDDDE